MTRVARSRSADDRVVSIADRIDDRRRVLRQTGLVVSDRQVRRDSVVATESQLGLDEVPVPADVAGTMDECKGRHLNPTPDLGRLTEISLLDQRPRSIERAPHADLPAAVERPGTHQ